MNNVLSNDLINLEPKLSESNHVMDINIDGIKVAQVEYKKGPVGLTYIDFGEQRTKIYTEIRGGFPGVIGSLSTSGKSHIDGINIAGGSTLGLESTTGIQAETLRKSNYESWRDICGAIIYSHNFIRNKIYPDKELGRFALNNLNTKLYSGQVGAGLCAGKGQGWALRNYSNGIKILALVVNNAAGEVYENNKKIAGGMDFSKIDLGTNSTITVLITNMQLDHDELKQMTHQVNSSMAKIIRPFHTFFDGDVFYSCSTEMKEKPKNYGNNELVKFFIDCSNVIEEAIFNSTLELLYPMM